MYLSEGYAQGYRSSVEQVAGDGTIIPLEGLAGAFPTTFERFHLGYAESVSAVDYIVSTKGRDALVAMIRSYATGLTDDEAFQAALGVDVAGFEAEWLASLGAKPPVRHGPQPAPPGPVPEGWSGAAPNPSVGPGAAASPTPTTNQPLPAAPGAAEFAAGPGPHRAGPRGRAGRWPRPAGRQPPQPRVDPADPTEPAGAVTDRVGRLRSIPTWQITLGLALLALGFLIAAQLAAEGPRVRYTTQERSPLVETTLVLQGQQDALKAQIVDLREQIQILEEQGQGTTATVRDLNDRLDEAENRGRVDPARGPRARPPPLGFGAGDPGRSERGGLPRHRP